MYNFEYKTLFCLVDSWEEKIIKKKTNFRNELMHEASLMHLHFKKAAHWGQEIQFSIDNIELIKPQLSSSCIFNDQELIRMFDKSSFSLLNSAQTTKQFLQPQPRRLGYRNHLLPFCSLL